MTIAYRFPSDIIEQLAKPIQRVYFFLLVIALIGLLLHIVNSFLISEFNLVLFLIFAFVYGIMAYIGFRNARYYYQQMSSFEIEIDDEFIKCRQFSQPEIKLHKDDITELQEIVPTGNLIIKASRKEDTIYISKLVENHQELKKELEAWGQIIPASQQKIHLQIIGALTIASIIVSYVILQLGSVQSFISIAPLFTIFPLWLIAMYNVMPDSTPFLKRISWILLIPVAIVTVIVISWLV